jgi:hypothetical protein
LEFKTQIQTPHNPNNIQKLKKKQWNPRTIKVSDSDPPLKPVSLAKSPF